MDSLRHRPHLAPRGNRPRFDDSERGTTQLEARVALTAKLLTIE